MWKVPLFSLRKVTPHRLATLLCGKKKFEYVSENGPFSVKDEKEVLRLLSEFELPTEDLTINKLQDFLFIKKGRAIMFKGKQMFKFRNISIVAAILTLSINVSAL